MTTAHGGSDHAHGHAQVDLYTGVQGNRAVLIPIDHHVNAQGPIIVRGNEGLDGLKNLN